MSPEYQALYRDPRWQRKKNLILQRDVYRCRDCTNGTVELQVHHCRYPGRGRPPWEIDDEFLLTVCDPCHKKRQELENQMKESLALVFAKSTPIELEALATFISGLALPGIHSEVLMKGQCEFMSETRWIQYAEVCPTVRPHVEAVIGRVIEWPK